jgi:hypothetical protein
VPDLQDHLLTHILGILETAHLPATPNVGEEARKHVAVQILGAGFVGLLRHPDRHAYTAYASAIPATGTAAEHS